MEPALSPEEPSEQKRVHIRGSELVENYTVYIIEVEVGKHRWTVKHRYSDFHDLHEKLTVERKIDKNLLPPKKIIGKNSKSLVEKREKELEVYLQTLLAKFPLAAPKVLSYFLHFHLYEINGITAALAEELFHKGEQLLAAGEVFCLRPLQLYAIAQQLRLAKPTCANGDARADLGHILDFTCRLKYLKISGTQGSLGSSNINELQLPFDLSIFKSLLHIEINQCDGKQIQGLPYLKPTLATMSVHHTTSSMKDILVPEAFDFEKWEPEGVNSDSQVLAIIPTWKTLTTLDMSHNFISSIDESVKLIPKVEFLDLSHNGLSRVENLQHLYNLIHLDLSYNKLSLLESLHTKLGNIKTLNLSGNLLESLSGLNKLYSLVNLDLTHNKLAQLEEIKNIGSLPCLEKLSLSSNPLSIIPDYRTKVLAQFWDRASEVCLDGIATTEKELDTVEVLKAIQKAKEAKDRMNNADKKISEDTRPPPASLKASCSSSLPARPSSPSLSQHASSSQEVTYRNAAQPRIDKSTPMDSTITQRCSNIVAASCEDTQQIINSSSLISQNKSCCYCCTEAKHRNWADMNMTIVLPFSCVSCTETNVDFTTHLSALVSRATKAQQSTSKSDKHTEPVKESRHPPLGDGYFEMTLDEEVKNPTFTLASEVQVENPSGRDQHHINKMFWIFCIQVDKDHKQFVTCVVFLDNLLAIFQVPQTDLTGHIQRACVDMEAILTVPYSDIEGFGFDIPEVCISLKLKACETRWFFLTDSQNSAELFSYLTRFASTANKCSLFPDYMGPKLQDLINQLLEVNQLTDNSSSVKAVFVAYLLNTEELNSCTKQATCISNVSSSPGKETSFSNIFSLLLQSNTQKQFLYVPCLLILTLNYFYVIRVDFVALANKTSAINKTNCWKFTQIPLASILQSPKQECSSRPSSPPCTGAFRDRYVVELMTGYKFVTAVFLLPQDKFLFLRLFSQLRASLQDVKTIAFSTTRKCHRPIKNYTLASVMTQRTPDSSPQGFSRPHLTLSLLYPSDPLIQKLTEENHCPFHLQVSPSLDFLTGLKGVELVEFFYSSIAEVENEELRHLIWSAVVFYKYPDVEMTACIMLSTKAVYFILADSAAELNDQTLVWNSVADGEKQDFHLSYCLVIKLNELQSVSVGLFDQYFRITGTSAGHIISCLSRDSYATHLFIQQLMAVLSLLEKTPSPEPAEQDFYTEFSKKSTGKMENYELVHSSRVKFIYPSEDEIGNLTYIVAEKTGELSNLLSCNILLYVLVFQVCHFKSTALENQPVLHAKTLILTSTYMFLFDEDYVSYPLPDFAKEPPQKEKYQLTDARRIRDLDRVLMGYQPYPQALTFVFDDVQSPDLLCGLTMDHFADEQISSMKAGSGNDTTNQEIQWCVFVPGADSREKLISLLARQWEILCSRELPVELTG
ncbi:LOW QUALITY PROTEIN: nischarin [Erpetoichthys calabaricus]|uniref:LOW QUALITY PROTEIN: nischarin n=1 Tax=Erpetoichthys calabaricus TaxID=27687 RepID=UPI002234AE59|nr:LOW QUALITY PROTEIN: nischarin [Erpetoichthys calabaricus]